MTNSATPPHSIAEASMTRSPIGAAAAASIRISSISNQMARPSSATPNAIIAQCPGLTRPSSRAGASITMPASQRLTGRSARRKA